MKPEYEIKFYPIDVSTTQQKLLHHNAQLQQPETLMKRTIYPVEYNADQSLKTWVRIRTEGAKTTLTLKKIVTPQTIDGTLETEITVNSFEDACTIVQTLGFKQLSYQENKRETWSLHKTIITIDTWPGLEPLLEIEGPTPNDVTGTAKLLELEYNQGTMHAISHIYQEKYGLSATEFNNITTLTFETANSVLQKTSVA